MPAELNCQLESLLCAAIEIRSTTEREAYLDKACGTDAELRGRVERLVVAHFQAGGFLKDGDESFGETMALPTLEQPGGRIGNYKLLEQIGEGGMGIVYMADQTEPVRRRVALKITKPGMDSRQVIARFEAERQALAMMEHPNIAKVLDAGTTDGGRPYFVMELVRGITITEYCDKAQLSPRNRLELVITVCQAVQHAHTKGVIHRDLKPSNILVTLHDGRPVPKVIDFGIAKAIHQPLTERTLFTGYGQMVGTPLYMSPEQTEMSGLDVDTRSDVYSLGVLLYELLTGQTPFDKSVLLKAGYDEMRRIIREVEPLRPSHRVSTLAAEAVSTLSDRLGINDRQLRNTLRGELDWIVMKALEKDRTRRYETPNALAADVRRYLDDLPVEACPPSKTYRINKLLRRYRTQVAFVALLCLVGILVAGFTGRSWFLYGERVRESLVAARASLDANSLAPAEAYLDQSRLLLVNGTWLSEFAARQKNLAAELEKRRKDQADLKLFLHLVDESQGEDNPNEAVKRALVIFEISVDENWRVKLKSRYFTESEQQQVIEAAYVALIIQANHAVQAELDHESLKAQSMLDRAASFHIKTKPFHLVQARIYRNLKEELAAAAEDAKIDSSPSINAEDEYLLGRTAVRNGDLVEAMRAYQAALRIRPDHYYSLLFLAQLLENKEIGRAAEAVHLKTACVALRPGKRTPYLSRAMTYFQLRDLPAAEADYTKAIELSKTEYDRIVATEKRQEFYSSTGESQKERRDAEEIVRLYEKLLPTVRQEVGAESGYTYNLMSQLGIAYQRLNRLDEAIQIFEQSYEGYLKLNGEKDLSTIGVLRFLADCYAQRGELEQAEALLEKVVKVGKIGMGPDHLVTLTSMFRLAKVYNSRGKVEEALAVISHVATRRRAKSGAADANTLVNEDLWSTVQMQTGQVVEAIKRWEDCYAVSVNELGPTDPTTVDICTHLAQAYTEVGTFDRAIELLEMAIKKHPVSTGKSALGLIDLKLALSDVYSKVERFDEALGLGKDVVADFTAIVGPDHSATRAAMRSLGYIYLANKQFEIALPILLQSVELGCVANKSQLSFAGQQVSVGRMLLLAGEYASAEPLLVESVATLQRLKPDSWTTYSAQSMLGGVLAGLCRYEEAEPLLIGGYEGMEARQSKLLYAGTKRFREAAERIVKYYDSVGDSEKSELWQSKLMMLPSLE